MSIFTSHSLDLKLNKQNKLFSSNFVFIMAEAVFVVYRINIYCISRMKIDQFVFVSVPRILLLVFKTPQMFLKLLGIFLD